MADVWSYCPRCARWFSSPLTAAGQRSERCPVCQDAGVAARDHAPGAIAYGGGDR